MSNHTTTMDDGQEAAQMDHCPMAQAFEEIGAQWRLVLLHSLHLVGEQRFNEIEENVPTSSSNLARVLKELEDMEFVHRRVEDRPIATYYRLTEKGEALANVFGEIEVWADDWTRSQSTAFKPES